MTKNSHPGEPGSTMDEFARAPRHYAQDGARVDQPHPVGPSSTVDEFCDRHRISRGLLYKIVKAGTGPRLTKINERTIITAKDEAAWLESLHRTDE